MSTPASPRLASKRQFCSRATVKTERPATLSEVWRNEIRWRRAHLASLFRHSNFFFSSPFTVVYNLYIYVLSWFVAVFTVLIGVIVLAGGGDSSITALGLWTIFVVWVLLRR